MSVTVSLFNKMRFTLKRIIAVGLWELYRVSRNRRLMRQLAVLLFLTALIYTLARSTWNAEDLENELEEEYENHLSENKEELIKQAEVLLINGVSWRIKNKESTPDDAFFAVAFILGYAKSGLLPQNEFISSTSSEILAPVSLTHPSFYPITVLAQNLSFAIERNELTLSRHPDFSNYAENPNLILQGQCWGELVLKGCEMSDLCREKYSYFDDVMYTLTHDVLYYVLRMKMGCKDEPEAIERFCQRSYDEVHKTWKWLKNAKGPFFCEADMFIEQVLFCSMLGYKQFMQLRWIEYIMKLAKNGYCIWKNPYLEYDPTLKMSCHHNVSYTQDYLPWKLDMTDGCSEHATGLLQILLAHFLYENKIQGQ